MKRDLSAQRGTRERVHAALPFLAATLVAALLVGFATCVARSDAVSTAPFDDGNQASIRRTPRVRSTAEVKDDAPDCGSIHATVTSLDRRAIPGATVSLVRGPVEEWWSSVDMRRPLDDEPVTPDRSVGCDASGAARFDGVPPGRWWVIAQAPGFGRHAIGGITLREGAPGLESCVALGPGHGLSGTVFDPEGSPAPGVRLILRPRIMATVWASDALWLRATTDAQGRYRFEDVPMGDCALFYAPQPHIIVFEGNLRVPAIQQMDIREAAGGLIEGTVRDSESGEPVAGARVVAMAMPDVNQTYDLGAGSTDAAGRFGLHTYRSTSDPHSLRVEHPLYAPTPLDDTGWISQQVAHFATTQRIVADLRVTRAASLRGVVLAPWGPVGGARVEAFNAKVTRETRTARDGSYSFDRLDPGEMSLTFGLRRGVEVRRDSPTLLAGAATVQDVTLEASRAEIRGIVTDGDGSPVAGAVVTHGDGPRAVTVRTDGEGNYSIDAWFVADHAEVTVSCDGFESQYLDVSLDSPYEPVELRRPGRTMGSVHDVDGNPVAGARVMPFAGTWRWNDEEQVAWTGAGQAVSLADGSFVLSVPDLPGVFAFSPLDGATIGEGVDVVIPAVRPIVGRVRRSDTGEPVAHVDVLEATEGTRGVLIGRTDAEGRFVVQHQPGEARSLRFARAGWLDENVSDAAMDGDEVRVALRRSPLPLTGVVRDSEGNPARYVLVEDALQTRSPSGLLNRTDSDGRFVITSAPERPRTLRVADYDDEFEPTDVDVPAATTDLVVTLRRKAPR